MYSPFINEIHNQCDLDSEVISVFENKSTTKINENIEVASVKDKSQSNFIS